MERFEAVNRAERNDAARPSVSLTGQSEYNQTHSAQSFTDMLLVQNEYPFTVVLCISQLHVCAVSL